MRVRVGVGEEEEDGRERVAEDGGGEDGEGGGERDGAVYGAQGGGEEGGEEEVEGCDDADALELVGDAEKERAVRRQLFFFFGEGSGREGLQREDVEAVGGAVAFDRPDDEDGEEQREEVGELDGVGGVVSVYRVAEAGGECGEHLVDGANAGVIRSQGRADEGWGIVVPAQQVEVDPHGLLRHKEQDTKDHGGDLRRNMVDR